jgi:hypothetical protein
MAERRWCRFKCGVPPRTIAIVSGAPQSSVGKADPSDEREVPLAGHFVFLAPCSVRSAAAAPRHASTHQTDRAEFIEFNEILIAFFRTRLPAFKPVH